MGRWDSSGRVLKDGFNSLHRLSIMLRFTKCESHISCILDHTVRQYSSDGGEATLCTLRISN